MLHNRLEPRTHTLVARTILRRSDTGGGLRLLRLPALAARFRQTRLHGAPFAL